MHTSRNAVLENVRRYRAIASYSDKPRPSVRFNAARSWTKLRNGKIAHWRNSNRILWPVRWAMTNNRYPDALTYYAIAF